MRAHNSCTYLGGRIHVRPVHSNDGEVKHTMARSVVLVHVWVHWLARTAFGAHLVEVGVGGGGGGLG